MEKVLGSIPSYSIHHHHRFDSVSYASVGIAGVVKKFFFPRVEWIRGGEREKGVKKFLAVQWDWVDQAEFLAGMNEVGYRRGSRRL